MLNWTYNPNALPRAGPRIQVEASVHPAVAKLLSDKGDTVPAPISGLALIDTGASITSIDMVVAQQLNLQAAGKSQIHTASGLIEVPQFFFVLRLLPTMANLTCAPGLSANLKSQGLIALIGMDILHQGIFVVNGPGQMVTFAM